MAFKFARAAGITAGVVASYAAVRALRQAVLPSLAGQVVLITGGSRGLGLLLAREYARRGCKICICARDRAELDNAENDLKQLGADVLALVCDVSDQIQVDDLVRQTIDHFGALDILVNNAGIIQVGPLDKMTARDFEHANQVIYLGAVYATMAVLPHMRERGAGRIVNVTSIGGKLSIPHLLPYNAAKFALVGFSEGLRAELKRDGILVTTIIPGLMRTGSPVNAWFKGERTREFTWFSLGDSLPLTSMSAYRAARRIVEATRRGEAVVVLGWQAKLARLAHALLPSLVVESMSVVNRALPTGGEEEPARGAELAGEAPSRVTRMVERAAEQTNEFGVESPEP